MTITDPCALNRSDEAASTAAGDDQIRVETCTDPSGLNRSNEAASTAADDDQITISKACNFRLKCKLSQIFYSKFIERLFLWKIFSWKQFIVCCIATK